MRSTETPRRVWFRPNSATRLRCRQCVAGRHLRCLAGWARHRSDRQRTGRRQRDQLHDLRDRGSNQRRRRPKASSTPRSATTTSAARRTTSSWSPRPARETFPSAWAWITSRSTVWPSRRSAPTATPLNSNVTVEPFDRQSADWWRRGRHQRECRRGPEPVHVRQYALRQPS